MFSGWGLQLGGWWDNRRGEWWLVGQMLLIAAHLLPAWPRSSRFGLEAWPWQLHLLGAGLLMIGLLLALQAFVSLGSSLSPLPEPKHGNELVCCGAYERCRHPMYQAVLICSLGVVIGLGSLLHLLLLLLLVLVLGESPPGRTRHGQPPPGLRPLSAAHSGHRAESSLAGLALMETPSSSPC